MHYLSVNEARERSGLRVVLCAGVPGVWGEAVKAVFDAKGLDYVPVAQEVGQENRELLEWTGQTSAPVVAYNDERIRITWESFIWLAERLASEPPLIPAEPAQRALMFGLTREIAGENGLGWCRRLQSIAASGGPEAAPAMARLADRYGYHEQRVEAVNERVLEILGLLSDTVQQAAGDYFIGGRLSALDLYSAIFVAVMVAPLPHEVIPMPDHMRAGFEAGVPGLDKARVAPLLAHRDFVFDRHIRTPLTF